MASKKLLEAFNNKIIIYLLGLGAKVYGGQVIMHWYHIETKAGKLDIMLHKPQEASKIYSIFCCFEFPGKAAEVLEKTPIGDLTGNLNKFSGKWNFHKGNKEDCFNAFSKSLEAIL